MARVIHYEDFALAIERDGGDAYRVRALSSPYGLTAAPFALPFCRQELEDLIRDVRAGIRFCAGDSQAVRHLMRPRSESEPGLSLPKTGARLFDALFYDTVREIFLMCRGRTESLPDRGLRIRLLLPAETGDLALALPWELLYCAQTRDFLARSVLTPVVRQLVMPQVSSSFPQPPADRVRILIAVATPSDVDPLNEADERARILKAWCEQQGAEVEVRRTLAGIYEALREKHCQVVHFITHGIFEPETGVGSLLLETSQGEPHAVSGSLLAETLHASRELRMVFLNSCESASMSHRSGQDPLLGAAAALIRRNVPAVIAMQFPISDVAARIFSEAVYRSLARGSSIDAAVGDGRLAIHQADADTWEWITPVLVIGSGVEVLRPLVEARSARGEEAVARIGKLLSARSYGRARQEIEAGLEKSPDLADLHYYLALAVLGDRRPRFLKVEEFRQIEPAARRVLELDGCAAHHLCFLAFLYKDFFLENYLVCPEPGYQALLGRAVALPLHIAKLDELAHLVPAARPVVDLVVRQMRSESA